MLQYCLQYTMQSWVRIVLDTDVIVTALRSDAGTSSPQSGATSWHSPPFANLFCCVRSSVVRILTRPLQKIQGQLQDAGALETIVHYLALLEKAFLIAPLTKYSPRPALEVFLIGLDPTFVSPGAISPRITCFGRGFSGIKFSARTRLTKTMFSAMR